MTKEEYEDRCAPIHEMISMLRKRHEEELKPWFDRLMAINDYYNPPILVARATWERLQMEQGIRSGSVSDGGENEVRALDIAKHAIVEAVSVTNWQVLWQRLGEAEAVLDEGSSVETGTKP